jgi:membrane fusion protein (multidrug efflux system)
VASPDATRVDVAEMRKSDAHLRLSLPGEVQASRDAQLASSQGGLVESVLVSVGDTVRRGQILARVNAALHEAALETVSAQARLVESQLRRLQGIGDLATASQLEQAQTRLTIALAAERQAEVHLQHARISAPFSGTISDVGIEIGEVAAPAAPLIRLVRTNPAIVSLSVADRDVVALEEGMQATIAVSGRPESFTGAVTHISPAANLKTRTFLVEVEVDNSEGLLLPGMIARVEVESPLVSGQVLIPQDFLVTLPESQGVFVVFEGRAAWRELTLGTVVQRQVVVRQGLGVGDRVIVGGQRDLSEGDLLLVSRDGICCESGRIDWGS